ncbi:hypothetical protein E2C01_094792 [Portunus trituberculatus]|uniref:Uncharacterized protein n=1 Tax=Portunus trituberculatus TaxID=210409 RepID=A0A5B7JN39_PORTR|nr:hypothetical protein [Portunus trituberculatus]
MPHERPGSPSTHHVPSRSELVEREQRYNQLSSQYLSLVSHLEALTSSSVAGASLNPNSSSSSRTVSNVVFVLFFLVFSCFVFLLVMELLSMLTPYPPLKQ